MFVNAKMLGNSVKGNNQGGGEDDSEAVPGLVSHVGDIGIKKNEIRDSGDEAAMEAGVVTPERSVRIDGEDSGKELREKEKN